MEPKNNSIDVMGPATPEKAGAFVPVDNLQNTIPTPEAPIASPEQARSAEQLAVDHAGSMPLPAAPPPTTVQQPVAPQPSAPENTMQVITPPSATDGNLIEKEWLDKVKQVINYTADDPHAQQREISRLMADYVLKRTGRKIGKDGGQG